MDSSDVGLPVWFLFSCKTYLTGFFTFADLGPCLAQFKNSISIVIFFKSPYLDINVTQIGFAVTFSFSLLAYDRGVGNCLSIVSVFSLDCLALI